MKRKRLEAPRWVGLCVMLCGLCLLAFGIWRGEMAVVVKKAINICLECIGIG